MLRVRALPARRATGTAGAGVALLAAAPTPMRAHVARLGETRLGFVATVRDGPRIVLGDRRRPRAKWVAAARVLGDAGAAGAGYIDVRTPERAAAGGFAPSTTG